jgi:methionine-rich copper-binding protein CopC
MSQSFFRARMARQALVAIAASLAAIFASSAAYAHAELVRATPAVGGVVASATEIRLRFSEGVEPRFSGLTLTAADGSNVPLGEPKAEGATRACSSRRSPRR